jgi:hypothetical protein
MNTKFVVDESGNKPLILDLLDDGYGIEREQRLVIGQRDLKAIL